MYVNPRNVEVLKPIMADGLPVDVIRAAASLNLGLFQVDLNPKNISGALIRNEFLAQYGVQSVHISALPVDGWTVLVNSQEGRQRQRFTIAHEIGHFLMHRRLEEVADGRLEDSKFFRSELSNQYEVEANRFAAELLMPREKIEADCNNYSPSSLAKRYDVSEEAMNIRLGLLKAK